jgi:hypothetical protein
LETGELMKDRNGNQIFNGDIVYVHIPPTLYKTSRLGVSYFGRVIEVKSIKTGYGNGGYIKIAIPELHGNDIARDSKYITKLPPDQAMLWKLENE